MKAITLWEPWGSAIALGLKRIETRSWATNYTGPIAIHAARSTEGRYFFEELSGEDKKAFVMAGYCRWCDLPLGCVVATAVLECCRTTNSLAVSETYPVSAREYSWGNYEEGRYGWLLADVKRLDKPIPARGFQQLWEWNQTAPPDLRSAGTAAANTERLL